MGTAIFPLSSEETRMLEGAGRQAVADVNKLFSKERLQQDAMHDERMRLARDLHDGMLQSLTGAVLQLEAVWHLIETNPQAARERLRDVQQMISQEQRELRVWIESFKPAAPLAAASGGELVAMLEQLRQRVAWQWGLCVEISVEIRRAVPRVLGDEIYRIVQEALTNVGRHAGASIAHVSLKLGLGSGPVHIDVSDDGSGFPYRGRFNLGELMARRIGPNSLRERVASLRGEMVLTSELSGSRLEISLPVSQGSAHPARNRASA